MGKTKIGQYIPKDTNVYFSDYAKLIEADYTLKTSLYLDMYYFYNTAYIFDSENDSDKSFETNETYKIIISPKIFLENDEMDFSDSTMKFLPIIGKYSSINQSLLKGGFSLVDNLDLTSIYNGQTKDNLPYFQILYSPKTACDTIELQYCHPYTDFENGIDENNKSAFYQCKSKLLTYNTDLKQWEDTEKSGILIQKFANLMYLSADEGGMGLSEGSYITKIGVRAKPGTQFILNNEIFKIGKSGIFEFENENISFTDFGIITDTTDIIVDYQYEEEE